jgi:hypothetical protein
LVGEVYGYGIGKQIYDFGDKKVNYFAKWFCLFNQF